MNKKSIISLTLLVILVFSISIGNAENLDTRDIIDMESLLEKGEVLLDQRKLTDKTLEIFTELNNEHYSKIIEAGKIIKEEQIQLKPTGLNLQNETKDKGLEKSLDNKLNHMGIYATDLPEQLDYSDSQYLPPVGRQMEDSCVGWATGYYLRTYQQGRDLGWKIKDGEERKDNRVFSPSFIYNQINEGVDEGAYMEDAGRLLEEVGAAALENFPYRPKDYLSQPDQETIESAYPHRILDWKIIYTKNDSKQYIIQKTKEYLNTEDLLVAGIKVGFKFNDPWKDEYGNAIVSQENYANYGHAVTLVGYDDNLETPDGQGAFKIVNSYGKDWGNDGFAYLTYENYVTNIQAGYVFTDLVNEDYEVTEDLNAEILDGVTFEVQLVGNGKYDLEILDNKGNKVYEEMNILGKPGINIVYWNGLDLNNNPVADGQYSFKLLGQNYTFNKEGKLKTATARLNKLDGEIKSMNVNLSTKKQGSLNLSIESKGKTIPIHQGISLDGNKEYNYNIDILKYVSSKDLKESKIILDIQ